jgi:response regulator RpfG family c-di-GMP phosphodiesterase
MAKADPIILIDDDPEDAELLREVLHDLGIQSKLIHFDVCSKAFDYLKNTPDNPFLIISDVNLPRQSGIEFKRQIDEDPQLRSKSIPFVFLSTSIDQKSVNTAYKEMTVQGFFQKPDSFNELTAVIKLLMDYWKLCRHPNS